MKYTTFFLIVTGFFLATSCRDADPTSSRGKLAQEKKESTYQDGKKNASEAKFVALSTSQGQCTPSRSEDSTRLAITTQPKMVWNVENRASPEMVPDFVIRGFKNDGETCLMIPHYDLGMTCGPNLNSLAQLPKSVYKSPKNVDFPSYDYKNWIASPYVESKDRIFALAHSEWYQCLNFPNDPAKKCSVGNNQFWSWSNAISSYYSKDLGRSWARHATLQRPAELSDVYPSLWTKKMVHYGFLHPGNIIAEKGYFYAFATLVKRDMQTGDLTKQGIVLLKTSELGASEWEQVVPSGEAVVDPFEGLVLPGTRGWDMATVTFNKSLCKYLLTFWDYNSKKSRYTTFDSLENPVFGPIRDIENQAFVAIPGNESPTGFVPANYPTSQIDPDSPGNNFEFTDSSFFLHVSSFVSSDVMRRSMYRTEVRLADAFAIPTIAAEEASSTPPSNQGVVSPSKGVLGNIDGIFNEAGSLWLKGWACDISQATNIKVHLYMGAAAPSGIYVGQYTASEESEPGVSVACGTQGVRHRFSINIAALNKPENSGRSLFVYGISVSNGSNSRLSNSGKYSIMGVTSAPVTTPPSGVNPPSNGEAKASHSVYRFSKGIGQLYSTSSSEGIGGGYVFEGVAFKLFSKFSEGTVALYRCYNLQQQEHFLSVAANCEGAVVEGVLGYVGTSQMPETQPLVRCYNKQTFFHLSTVNVSECSDESFVLEGTQGYVPTAL